MIYLDNAATTRYKPEEVYGAFEHYIREIGVSPGRGCYGPGIEASRLLYQIRKKVGSFFGLKKSANVVFTKNSTEAINLFFRGILNSGDHVVITCYEHNAVLRTLENLKRKRKIEYSIICREDLLQESEKVYEKYCKENTRIFASTLASNLTGRIVFREDVFRYMHKKGIITFVDASQGAGKLPLRMSEQRIDYLAFTGHKDLMALPGVGGLCCRRKDEVKPLIQGGTGIFGDTYVNPDVFPEGLEAGTLNMPAICALNAAIRYLEQHQTELMEKDHKLRGILLEKLSELEHIEIYDSQEPGIGAVGFNVKGHSSADIVKKLDESGICVRGGIHCTVLAHEALGTVNTGMVRVSVGEQNTMEDIKKLIDVLKECR